jgi:hypothetical protein
LITITIFFDNIRFTNIDEMYNSLTQNANTYKRDLIGILINRNNDHWTALTALTKHCKPDSEGYRFRYIDSQDVIDNKKELKCRNFMLMRFKFLHIYFSHDQHRQYVWT